MQFPVVLTLLLSTALAAPSIEVSREVDAIPPFSPDVLERFNARIVTPELQALQNTPEVDASLDKRAITHIYVCVNSNFVAPCTNIALSINECYHLSEARGLKDNISSAGPDAGTYCCLWEDAGCEGRNYCFFNPWISSLSAVGFNDIASSVSCN